MRYVAKRELCDKDYKTQRAQGYENIPAGAELEWVGMMTNFYGRYAKVRYEGRLYYVDPDGVVSDDGGGA